MTVIHRPLLPALSQVATMPFGKSRSGWNKKNQSDGQTARSRLHQANMMVAVSHASPFMLGVVRRLPAAADLQLAKVQVEGKEGRRSILSLPQSGSRASDLKHTQGRVLYDCV
jgi:hypothetical protein